MAILNSDALREIESKVVRWKRNGHVPHGYPLSEVTDLCDTISALKHEKRSGRGSQSNEARPLLI